MHCLDIVLKMSQSGQRYLILSLPLPPPVFLLLHAVFLVLQWKVGKLITEK